MHINFAMILRQTVKTLTKFLSSSYLLTRVKKQNQLSLS